MCLLHDVETEAEAFMQLTFCPCAAGSRYRMDYMKFANYHRDTNADITIGCIPYGDERAKEFGLMKIDDKRRVTVSSCIL